MNAVSHIVIRKSTTANMKSQQYLHRENEVGTPMQTCWRGCVQLHTAKSSHPSTG